MNRGAITLLCAVLTGCAGTGLRYAAADLRSRLPAKTAVLPFDNESVNMRGAGQVRGLVEEALGGRGWALADRRAVDETLQRLGVSDGGQLGALDPKRLGAELGVSGLIYGTLEEFTFQNVGFVRRRVVRLSLKLVEASTGERLWEASGEDDTGRVALERRQAGRSFLEGVVEQAAETALGVPLLKESRAAVEKTVATLAGRL